MLCVCTSSGIRLYLRNVRDFQKYLQETFSNFFFLKVTTFCLSFQLTLNLNMLPLGHGVVVKWFGSPFSCSNSISMYHVSVQLDIVLLHITFLLFFIGQDHRQGIRGEATSPLTLQDPQC